MERPPCPKCASRGVKRYPQDFAGADWVPSPLLSSGPLRFLSGGPETYPQLYVCMGCGHNFERR